jgi:S-adenosylmethionine hydrolase
MSKIITFASDFGLNDGSVGVVKGVILLIEMIISSLESINSVIL